MQASSVRTTACAVGGLKTECDAASASLLAAQKEILALLEHLDSGKPLVPAPSPQGDGETRLQLQQRKNEPDVTVDELLDGLEPATAAAAMPSKWRDGSTAPPAPSRPLKESVNANADARDNESRPAIVPGYGAVDWIGGSQSIAACTRASAGAKEAGSAVGISPKTFSIRCALEYGQLHTLRVHTRKDAH